MIDQLPSDLLSFLKSRSQLEYDPSGLELGRVTLRDLEELELDEFRVVSSVNDAWQIEDPHRNDSGAYMIPAIDLVRKCRNYAPRGALVFIPELGLFGQHDDDHKAMTVFPRASWSQIEAEPYLFLNGQWEPETPSFNPKLNPIGRFEFRFD